MTSIIKIIVFLLGMCLSVQVIAALYRLLDLWYTINTAYLKVLQKILVWSGIIVVIALLLGNQWRGAFLWGLFLGVLYHFVNFFLLQALLKHQSQIKVVE